jgi:D-sedoheptulose 7-phosphate isomerase
MVEDLAAAAGLMLDALRGGGKVLVCGNGGSAAIAEHMVGELVGRFRRERPGWAAVSLVSNAAALTAVGNDYGFEQVFARQVQALAGPGDLVVGLSTSGRSANVVEALREARARGARTLALVGRKEGPLASLADLTLRVPSSDTPRLQEAHLLIMHILCGLVERTLCEE